MEKRFVERFISSRKDYFHPSQLYVVEDKLLAADDRKQNAVQDVQLQNPTIFMIVSILFGWLGFDRFLIGDKVMGIVKLCTLGGLGLLTLLDWIRGGSVVREKNFKAVMNVLE